MTGMSWRSGPRESVKCTDPLASTGHPLAVAHRDRWEEEVQEKFRRLFQKNA